MCTNNIYTLWQIENKAAFVLYDFEFQITICGKFSVGSALIPTNFEGHILFQSSGLDGGAPPQRLPGPPAPL